MVVYFNLHTLLGHFIRWVTEFDLICQCKLLYVFDKIDEQRECIIIDERQVVRATVRFWRIRGGRCARAGVAAISADIDYIGCSLWSVLIQRATNHYLFDEYVKVMVLIHF